MNPQILPHRGDARILSQLTWARLSERDQPVQIQVQVPGPVRPARTRRQRGQTQGPPWVQELWPVPLEHEGRWAEQHREAANQPPGIPRTTRAADLRLPTHWPASQQKARNPDGTEQQDPRGQQHRSIQASRPLQVRHAQREGSREQPEEVRQVRPPVARPQRQGPEAPRVRQAEQQNRAARCG